MQYTYKYYMDFRLLIMIKYLLDDNLLSFTYKLKKITKDNDKKIILNYTTLGGLTTC